MEQFIKCENWDTEHYTCGLCSCYLKMISCLLTDFTICVFQMCGGDCQRRPEPERAVFSIL